MRSLRVFGWARALGVAAVVTPAASGAFTINGANLEEAQRWALDYGLADGIQVGIDPAIAEAIGATTPQEEARVFETIDAAFRAWESPALGFDISIDSAVTVSPGSGFEIDVIALFPNHPAFLGQQVFGLAAWNVSNTERTLSNGMQLDGQVITGADIYLNIVLLSQLAPNLPDETTRLAALQRLLMHEIGHTLGLHHPGDSSNWDTDTDPTNAIVIDPADPFGNLIVSPNLPTDAIMTVRPCGADLLTCAPLFYTALTNDEIGGRDALYPVAVPEPALAPLLVFAAFALRGRRRT
ncbi:MAG TPA: hypothetical protein VFT98_03335 [Myxococcota bacterium]|nr:hypothetical protein [Myxococcota bacterium]